jgi:hypothetical protein
MYRGSAVLPGRQPAAAEIVRVGCDVRDSCKRHGAAPMSCRVSVDLAGYANLDLLDLAVQILRDQSESRPESDFQNQQPALQVLRLRTANDRKPEDNTEATRRTRPW